MTIEVQINHLDYFDGSCAIQLDLNFNFGRQHKLWPKIMIAENKKVTNAVTHTQIVIETNLRVLSPLNSLLLFLLSSISTIFPSLGFHQRKDPTMHRNPDQRPRSTKLTTIHGYAHSGDLAGFQKLLRENPSLLNERNAIVRSH